MEAWLAKRSDQELGIDEPDAKRPPEELFRQEWAQSLAMVQKEQLSPENLQEERLFRSTREALELVRLAGTSVGGLELLQIQEGALKKYPSLQLKLGVKGSALAVPVVVAVSKLSGGVPMTGFLKALEESVADPDTGAILLRPSPNTTLGPP